MGLRSTHSPVKEAALPLAYRLNGGNLHDTGRSPDQTPPAAMAEQETIMLQPKTANGEVP